MAAVVVTGADGSDTATQASRAAARLAVATHAELANVCAYASSKVERIEKAGETFIFSTEAAAERTAAEARRSLLRKFPYLRLTARAVEGSPADQPVRMAGQTSAALTMIDSKRAQGSARVLGSIAADVARNARNDVCAANTHKRP